MLRWPNWVLGNHDLARVSSRIGVAQSRVAHLLLLTLRGTPTVYYGDELGMMSVPVPRELWQDPAAIRQPDVPSQNRDPERTPMQWDDSPHAGFTTGDKTWLPLAADFALCNVAVQSSDANSFLTFFRAATLLRQNSAGLISGSYKSIDVLNEDIFAFTRISSPEQRYLIVLNFVDEPTVVSIPLDGVVRGTVLLSTVSTAVGHGVMMSDVRLRANEGTVIRF
eukprot:TRINITY_DN3099_c0_g2_i1.p3 TRINITY_DN3099_c0_g2~~TRINITY_DN3099_c0_g2_i1.p3  ORF type:complete len:223 (+),score=49.11 TRINITY_DN3099_c0_g2_i1:1072-1740(+)